MKTSRAPPRPPTATDDTSPAPSPTSNCSGDGSRVEQRRTGGPTGEQRGRGPTMNDADDTPPAPASQATACGVDRGWCTRGANNNGDDNDGDDCTNPRTPMTTGTTGTATTTAQDDGDGDDQMAPGHPHPTEDSTGRRNPRHQTLPLQATARREDGWCIR
jgi:hypothetical protein